MPIFNKSTVAVCVALSLALVCGRAGRADEKAADPDEEVLRQANVGTDGASLVKFLLNFPAHVDPQHLDALVRELGSKRFEGRERASKELVAYGQAALPSLRKALQSPDKEIVRRAKVCIEDIERRQAVPGVDEAVVRLLLERRPPGTVAALLRYLPFAADTETAEDIWYGLDALAAPGGKTDPALKAALQDPVPVRCAAAACILGRRIDPGLRTAVSKLLEDPDPAVRLRAAQGLLAARDKRALPTLVALLGEPSVQVAWQAEELLHWAAGDGAPSIAVGAGDAQSRGRCRKAWEDWWHRHGTKIDLDTREHNCRRPGLLLVNSYSDGRRPARVWLCGCDGKTRWELKLGMKEESDAWDMVLLENNRILLTEAERLTERSLDGKVLWQHKTTAFTCRRLPNGNTFFLYQREVGEITPGGETVNARKLESITRGGDSYLLECQLRLRNGRILCQFDADDGRTGYKSLVECDPVTGREQKPIHLQKGVFGYCDQELEDGHYLFYWGDPFSVFETDSAGKVVWRYSFRGGGYPVRLRNGNTVLNSGAASSPGRLFEVDRAGKVVWEAFTPDRVLGRVRVCLGLVRLGFDRPRPADFDLNRPIPYRLAGLKSKDVLVRRGTLEVLSLLGSGAAVLIPALIEALCDPDSDVRNSARALLEELGPRAAPELLKALKDSRPEMRVLAAGLLGQCRGDLQVVLPALLAALDDDKDSSVRQQALRSFAFLGRERKETVARILRALKDRDREVRRAAIQMLGTFGSTAKDAVPQLLELLKSRDQEMRCDTIRTLGDLGPADKRIVPALLALLDEKQDSKIRCDTIRTLSDLGPADKRVLPALLTLLDEKQDSDIRSEAIHALRRMDRGAARDAIPDLLKVANNKPAPTGTTDVEIQGMAALAVEQIAGAKDVVPTLVAILRDEKVQAPIRRKTFEALQKLGPRAEEAEPALIAILQDRGKRLEAGDATATLVGIGPGAVLSLANCFRFLPKANRCLALEKLQRMGPAAGKAAPIIRRALRDPDPEVSGLAWKGLSCLGSEAVAVLVPLVDNDDVPTRCRFIEALGAMGSTAKDAIPALTEALKDSSSSVRDAASGALKKIRP